jgi:hypothetical protein
MGIASSIGWEYWVLDEEWSVPGNAVLEHNALPGKYFDKLGVPRLYIQR